MEANISRGAEVVTLKTFAIREKRCTWTTCPDKRPLAKSEMEDINSGGAEVVAPKPTSSGDKVDLDYMPDN
eukprot:gene12988-5350_t